MKKVSSIIILLLIVTIPGSFAQEELSSQKMTLTPDNKSYEEGEIITITGTIEKVIPDMPVSLQIFFEKNLIQVSQVNVSQDGKFSDTFRAAGPQWKNEGTITIRANYGESSVETNIIFFKNTSGILSTNYEVNIPESGGTFDVQYTMKGGVVSEMKLNQKNLSLVMDIIANTDGSLEISLPRDNIDSKTNEGKDIDFIVLMYNDGSLVPSQTSYKKISDDDDSRIVNIPIKEGDTKIEIIGTYVVPEFGTIAMIVLAVAIVSIIAVSAKSRLSIMPRF